jgi:hypothetical protein
MAISSKIEEILLEITKNAGNISDSLEKGIGSVEVPGSAIYEINNLLTTAQNGYPYFGIVETSPLGFLASYGATTDRYNVIFSSGTVSYNGSLISLSQQKIPIKKEFLKNYYLTGSGSTAYKYGVTVGLPLEEAQKAIQTFNTTVSTASATGDTAIYITDSVSAESIGFPLEAHVGSVYLRFSGLNTEKTALFIDTNYYTSAGYGLLPSDITADTPVKYIFQPRLKYITGFPVETVSEDPEAFIYYPPMPSTWLPVAKILLKSPDNPIVAGTGNSAWVRTVIDMPTSTSSNLILGDSADVQDVVSACSSSIKNLQAYKNDISIANIINAVTSYSSALANLEGYTINKYWSLQPFRPTQYYSKGLSFSGLERFEFPENFTKAYFNINSSDLQHTFATFRGDLVTYNSPVIGTSSIASTDLTLGIIAASANVSALQPGTQIYGVTAVRTVEGTDYVETVPTYVSAISLNTTTGNYLSELTWQGAGITNALFYHVYKRPSLSTETIEKRLTIVDDIQYAPYISLTPVTDNSNLNLSQYTALKFTTTSDCYIGGVSIKLGFNAANQVASSGSTGLNFNIYTDNSGSPNYSGLLTEQTVLNYSDILEGSATYTVRFPAGINVTSGSSYWLVINKPQSFTTGIGTTDLRLRYINSGSGLAKTLNATFDGSSSWSSFTGEGYLKLRGYIDDGSVLGESFKRGIKLTGRISNTSRRLSVYVPPVDDIVDNTGLFFNGSSVAIASTTDKTIKNELVVSVTAKLGETGTEKTMSVTVPQGTVRDTRFLLGESTDIFDRVTNVVVSPGTNLKRISNGPILWDVYDLITIETEP